MNIINSILVLLIVSSCTSNNKEQSSIEINKVSEQVIDVSSLEENTQVIKKDTEKPVEIVHDFDVNESNPTVPLVTKPKVEKTPAPEIVENSTNEKLESNLRPEEELNEEKKKVLETIPNHKDWDELLKMYVSESGRVNYSGFKSNINKLKSYLEYLSKYPVKENWSKNEELVYWFNLYNASTVYLIASQYPVKSITNLEKGKPWDKKFIKSGSNTYSLNDIENTIVRPKFKEPLVHVAFNCAAVSCPNLLNEAFVADRLDSQLVLQAKKWINDPSKNKLSADKIEVSKIFEWYKDDFTSSGGLIGFINKYASTKVNSNAKTNFLEYNWQLNE